MSVITVNNASKTYGSQEELKVEALKPTSFSIERGEFVCVIGTSGSGKSTLLHLLAGVDEASSGSIIINGRDITKLNHDTLAIFRRREVGIIYQFFNLVPVLTVKENIELPIMLDEKQVNQAYFNELVELLGIKDRLDFYPSKLSGGEQQRVAIARALIHKPSIILADEPTGNLNSRLAKEIMEFLVLACKRYNQTIIMITHDLNLAKYADRVMEIQDGHIIKDYITTSDMEIIKETEIHEIDKEKMLQNAEQRLNSIVYEAVKTESEGFNQDGDYIIDYDQWLQTITSIYMVYDREMQNVTEIPSSMQLYYDMFKEGMTAFENNNSIILMKINRNRTKERFTTIKEVNDYIDSLQEKMLMIPSRVQQMKEFINKDLSEANESK